MTPSRRLFVLLGAYEDLTERETSALRRGDIDYVLSIQERKSRLTDALQQARRETPLTPDDTTLLENRVRALQACETGNLHALREQMASVRQSLDELDRATQRSRQVRRGYTGMGGRMPAAHESVLGRA